MADRLIQHAIQWREDRASRANADGEWSNSGRDGCGPEGYKLLTKIGWGCLGLGLIGLGTFVACNVIPHVTR